MTIKLTAAEAHNILIDMLVQWCTVSKNFVLLQEQGMYEICAANLSQHIRLKMTVSETTELNQIAKDALATRSVYLPINFLDSSGEVYRITFEVNNPEIVSHGVYQIILGKEVLIRENVEKAFKEIKNFLAYEILYDQNLTSVLTPEKEQSVQLTLVQKVQQQLDLLNSLPPLSMEAQVEFPQAKVLIPRFISNASNWIKVYQSGNVYKLLECVSDVERNGYFLAGYFYQTHTDTNVEISIYAQPILEIIKLVDLNKTLA